MIDMYMIIGKRGYDLSMCRSFEKKAVNELRCIERHDILLCLTDSQLAAHGLSDPFALKALISDVRPISAFCATVSEVYFLFYYDHALEIVNRSFKKIYKLVYLLNSEEKINLTECY